MTNFLGILFVLLFVVTVLQSLVLLKVLKGQKALIADYEELVDKTQAGNDFVDRIKDNIPDLLSQVRDGLAPNISWLVEREHYNNTTDCPRRQGLEQKIKDLDISDFKWP